MYPEFLQYLRHIPSKTYPSGPIPHTCSLIWFLVPVLEKSEQEACVIARANISRLGKLQLLTNSTVKYLENNDSKNSHTAKLIRADRQISESDLHTIEAYWAESQLFKKNLILKQSKSLSVFKFFDAKLEISNICPQFCIRCFESALIRS